MNFYKNLAERAVVDVESFSAQLKQQKSLSHELRSKCRELEGRLGEKDSEIARLKLENHKLTSTASKDTELQELQDLMRESVAKNVALGQPNGAVGSPSSRTLMGWARDKLAEVEQLKGEAVKQEGKTKDALAELAKEQSDKDHLKAKLAEAETALGIPACVLAQA